MDDTPNPIPEDPDGSAVTRDPTSLGGPAPAEETMPQTCESAVVPAPPFRLDQFEVRRQIGRGGQGFVYEAFDHDLDRSAALKIVISRDQGPDALSRFEQEAKSLARLNHPNIVTIYTSKTTKMFGDRPARYFAMEYLPAAMPITEYAEHHKLPVYKRVELLQSLCLAIEAGHRQGVFHRDLKPPNLLVDKRDVPRVIDFGLAAGPSVRDDGAQRAREYGTAVGTPCYMAPEQFSGDPDLIDERSDIYGMGVVLYELLTAHLPYPVLGKHWREVGEIVREQPPEPPRRFRAELDGDLIAILLKALRKDPRDRYRSMQEFADDLGRWRSGDLPIACVPNPTSRPMAAARRHAVAKPKVAIAVCMAIGVVFADGVIRAGVSDRVPLDGVFERVAGRVRTAIGPGPLAFTTVRGLQIDEPGVRSLVDQVGLEGVRPGEIASYRPLHGYVLSKLAEAKPSVVAIDIAFADRDDPGDPAMVEGIQALRAGGSAVVLGLYNWPSQTPDPVTLDPDILADNPRGAPTGQFLRSGWRLDTAAQMPGDALASPSFALATVAALRMPAAPYTVRFDPDAAEVVLSPSAADAGSGQVIRSEHRVGVSFFREDAGRAGMLPNGTMVAYSVLDVPPLPDINAATISIADLPTLSPGELSELFFQRVVVIGQAASQADQVTHPSGEPIEGFKAQMVAIEALAKSRFIRRVTPPTHMLAMAIGAFFGVVLAFGGPRSMPNRALLLAAAVLTVCATTIVLLAVGVGFIDPLPVVAALLVTYFAALWIRGVRLVRGILPWTNRAPVGDTR